MKKIKFLLTPLLIALILQQSNCGLDIEESNTNFRWVEVGNELTYDLKFGELTISGYRKLEIKLSQGIRENKIFWETIPEIQNDPNKSMPLLSIFNHVYKLKDGLHTTRCASCNSNPCISIKNHLKVPANPLIGKSIPDFTCGDEVNGSDIVISTDSTITVPMGKFKTFVINDTLNRSIKFWNEKVGLIRVDNYKEFFGDTVILELSGKNY